MQYNKSNAPNVEIWQVAILLLAYSCNQPTQDTPAQDAGVIEESDYYQQDANSPDTQSMQTDRPFAVTSVQPNHGPFSLFSEVMVRGRGFMENATVTFGGVEASCVYTDENRISCAVPPGEAETFINVAVSQAAILGEEEAVLEDAFYYDPCSLLPTSGPAAGGTYVSITCTGTSFEGGEEIFFNGSPARNIEVLHREEIHCQTPESVPGEASIEIQSMSGSILLPDAFSYSQGPNPTTAGLSGREIAGTVVITVFDSMTLAPLSDAFVMLGLERGGQYEGITDSTGEVAFSNPTLRGRQIMITVSHEPIPTPIDTDCDGESDSFAPDTLYETTSFTEFDATYVTVLLNPLPPMISLPQCELPPVVVLSFISGELLFPSGTEFGPYEWSMVPEPIPPDEEKIAFVFTSARDIFLDPMSPHYELADTGTFYGGPGHVVSQEDIGVDGFSYRIRTRFGAVAVYALAGIYNWREDKFTPYAFGVRRGIVVTPGETIEGQSIFMVTPMNESLAIELDNPPRPYGNDIGPNRYSVQAFIDLGLEGVIWMAHRTSESTQWSAGQRIPGWMQRGGELADASLILMGTAYSQTTDLETEEEMFVFPLSVRVKRGIENWEDTIILGDWINPAQMTSPSPFGIIENNYIEWSSGDGEIDFHRVMLTRGPPWWTIILPTEQQTLSLAEIPDIYVPDMEEGQIDIWHHRVWDNFYYDRWPYTSLGRDSQEAYAVHAWLINF